MFSSKSIIFLCLFIISCSSNEQCDEACNQSPDSGPCNAAYRKFYFDKTTSKCDTFLWGGCSGIIPFNTIEECLNCDCN